VQVRATSGQLVPLSKVIATTAGEPAVVLHDGRFRWVGLRVAGERAALDAALERIAVPLGVRRTVRESEQP
jgi:hypothetical protein